MRANPLDLPPPNLVLSPKIEILSSFDFSFLAMLSLMLAFETLAYSGWRSWMDYKRE